MSTKAAYGSHGHRQMMNKMDRRTFSSLFHRSQRSLERFGKVEESGGEDSGTCSDTELRSTGKDEEATSDFSEGEPESGEPQLRFHLSERSGGQDSGLERDETESETFAGKRYLQQLGLDTSTILSSKGSIRGVRNRVRAGVATFLQIQNSKSWQTREAGQVVIYTTTMGVIRETYQRCLKVRHILRTHLIKYTEKDVFMSREVQNEIKERMGTSEVRLPQVFVEGVLLGDADVIEKLNESGELRKILKPYKNPDVCTTCNVCGGYQLLPCGICNGSKKSVHRNHFNSELIALKCMNCDEVGLVRCYAC